MRAVTVVLVLGLLVSGGCWKSSHLRHHHKHKPKPVEPFPQIVYVGSVGAQAQLTVAGKEAKATVGSAIQVAGANGVWTDLLVNGKKVVLKEIQADKVILMVEGESETKAIPLIAAPAQPAAPPK